MTNPPQVENCFSYVECQFVVLLFLIGIDFCLRLRKAIKKKRKAIKKKKKAIKKKKKAIKKKKKAIKKMKKALKIFSIKMD